MDGMDAPARPVRLADMVSDWTADTQDIQSKIQTVYQRIQKERKMMEGFRAMAAATSNNDVRASCEAKIRDSDKTIQWFEQSLRDLQRKQGAASSSSSSSMSSSAAAAASETGSGPGTSPYGGGAGGAQGTTSSQSTLSSGSAASGSYSRTNSSTSTATAQTSVASTGRNRVLPPTPGSDGAASAQGPGQGYGQGSPRPFNNSSNAGAGYDNGMSSLSIRRKPQFTNLGEGSRGSVPVWPDSPYLIPRCT